MQYKSIRNRIRLVSATLGTLFLVLSISFFTANGQQKIKLLNDQLPSAYKQNPERIVTITALTAGTRHSRNGNPGSENNKLYNTAFMLDENGEFKGKYRKSHPTFGEQIFWVWSPGERFELIELDSVRYGVGQQNNRNVEAYTIMTDPATRPPWTEIFMDNAGRPQTQEQLLQRFNGRYDAHDPDSPATEPGIKGTLFTINGAPILPENSVIQGFNIYSDFPSGNIIIDKIKNDTVWIRPDLRDTRGDWFYWCFAVSKAKDKTLTFVFTKPDIFTTSGPAVSYDSGFNWEWLGAEVVPNESFSYTFNTDSEIRFSMGMPYTQKQFDLFIQPYKKSDLITLDALAKTKSGRVIERLSIKPVNSEVKFKVLITARHHACEMMANYEMEGMIREIFNDKWLKNNVEFCFIPFMDKDGVEKGDQGKNRFPLDHNRDYNDKSIHESTAALKTWVPGWIENKPAVCLDLHCPFINGGNSENIYLPGLEDEKFAEQEKLFCKLLKSTNDGELKISEKIYFPFGSGWNTSENYKQGVSFRQWATSLEGIKLIVGIEFPYGKNEGQTITQANTRDFGADLIKAIKNYLKQL